MPVIEKKEKDNSKSGGILSTFPSFNCYAAAARATGMRPTQQDQYLVLPFTSYLCLAICDGHGTDGGLASVFVRRALERDLPSLSTLFEEPMIRRRSEVTHTASRRGSINEKERYNTITVCTALEHMLAKIAVELEENPTIDCYLSGTTLVLVIVTAKHVFSVNIGDSGARIATKCPEEIEFADGSSLGSSTTVGEYTVYRLTKDHTCDNPEEFRRVAGTEGARIERMELLPEERDDPEMIESNPLRIYKGTMPYPGLVMTRSLGDAVAHKLGVLSDPQISVAKICVPSVMVVASDGVWDGLSSEKAFARLVSEIPSTTTAEKSVKDLISSALLGLESQNIADNVSAVVVFIKRA